MTSDHKSEIPRIVIADKTDPRIHEYQDLVSNRLSQTESNGFYMWAHQGGGGCTLECVFGPLGRPNFFMGVCLLERTLQNFWSVVILSTLQNPKSTLQNLTMDPYGPWMSGAKVSAMQGIWN